MPVIDKPLDATRGTALWAIHRLRSDLLPALLADLAKREAEGIERQQCVRVAKTLAFLAESTGAMAGGDAAWKSSLRSDLTAFHQTFVQHNMDLQNKDEAIKNRVVTLAQLRAIRQKLSDRIRRNLSVIQRELDLRAIASIFAAFRELAKEFPEILGQVGGAVERFDAGAK